MNKATLKRKSSPVLTSQDIVLGLEQIVNHLSSLNISPHQLAIVTTELNKAITSIKKQLAELSHE